MRYDTAIDHTDHEVVYAGTQEYIDQIPAGLSCEKFVWDARLPVEEQLRPWMDERPSFDRIFARHEQLIMPAATLREEFGIPGMRRAAALNFRDKVAMKRAVERTGVRVPRFVPAGHAGADAAPWRGKTIVKPRDGAASQGVELFDSFGEARASVLSRSGADRGSQRMYELEEYLSGPIWHVDGFLCDGEPVIAQPSRYVGTCLGFANGAPLGSVQLSNPRLEQMAVQCVEALGGKTVTFHLEAIETEGEFVFLEVAARCGGGYIVDAIEARHGVHLHTIDMASDIDGCLATRFLSAPRSPLAYGFFLFPGHVYGGAPCDVRTPEGVLDDPCVVSHRITAAGAPSKLRHSYRPEDLPLSGVVAGEDPDALSEWIERLFDGTSVVAGECTAVAA